MTIVERQSWQDEVIEAVQVGYMFKRLQLISERDDLIRRGRVTRENLATFGKVRNAKYRRLRYYGYAINQELRNVRDRCDRHLNQADDLAQWQQGVMLAIKWHMAGVVILEWSTPGYMVQSDMQHGSLHIFYGGIDRAQGEGHGHIVLGPDGWISYRRDPGHERGIQNHRQRNRRRGARSQHTSSVLASV